MRNSLNVEYPEGIDCVWMGIDQHNNVAVFITAGEGPIPFAVFTFEEFSKDGFELEILSLQKTTQAKVLVDVPNPSSFVELASRGFFVYDWGEFVYNPNSSQPSYRLVAQPTFPSKVDSLSLRLCKVASSVVFSGVMFAHAEAIDPTENLECLANRTL